MLKLTRTAIRQSVLRFARNESGATAIEYALISAGIGVVIVAAVLNLGTSVNAMFVTVSSALK